ncbi:MAG: hypothetical protein ABJA02_06885, partial [Acidobacteriota bacterium]
MADPITYFLQRVEGTVDLTLTSERFIAKTKGSGLLDKPRVTDISLGDLKNFCLVKTIGVQNLVGPGSDGDLTFDSEFIFSFLESGKLKNKRVFVNSRDPRFQAVLQGLTQLCPGASLLHLDPAEAQKQMGAVSSSKVLIV